MSNANTAGVGFPIRFPKGVPKPPGWIIPVLIGGIIGQIAWDYFTEEGESGGYDWSGWSISATCSTPVGAPRRWSQSLATTCLINQAVNFPTIRPQDNYAALAIVYEGAGGLLRLANSQNYSRDQPGVLLPWEINGSAGAYPPALPPRAPVRMPVSLPIYPTLQDVAPLTVAHPIPLPYLPGIRPALPVDPGHNGDGRFYPPAVAPGPLPTEVVVSPTRGRVRVIPRSSVANKPPGKGEKEAPKYRPNRAIQGVVRGLNGITEVKDFVVAVHDALPNRCAAKPVSLARERGAVGRQGKSVVGDYQQDGRSIRDKFNGRHNLPGWKVHTSTANDPAFEKYFRPRRVREKVNGEWVWRGKLKYTRTHRAPTVPEMMAALYKCADHLDTAKAIRNLAQEAFEDAAFGALGRAIARSIPQQYKRPVGPTAGFGFWPGI